MELSVCIDAVFKGVEPQEAIRRSAEIGYDAIEFWGWWNKDIDSLQSAAREHGVVIATFCTRFTSLVDQAQHADYVAGLADSLEIANRLGVSKLITQVGLALPDISAEKQETNLIAGLRLCRDLLEGHNVTLLVEPLNVRVDHAGYFLSRTDDACRIVEEVGSPNIKLLFDIYHQQITEGDVSRRLADAMVHIGHFHAAGNPGRGELDRGELSYPSIFKTIAESGYEGYVGLEYFPSEPWENGLLRAREQLAGALEGRNQAD